MSFCCFTHRVGLACYKVPFRIDLFLLLILIKFAMRKSSRFDPFLLRAPRNLPARHSGSAANIADLLLKTRAVSRPPRQTHQQIGNKHHQTDRKHLYFVGPPSATPPKRGGRRPFAAAALFWFRKINIFATCLVMFVFDLWMFLSRWL